jgi:hypothetical protein
MIPLELLIDEKLQWYGNKFTYVFRTFKLMGNFFFIKKLSAAER